MIDSIKKYIKKNFLNNTKNVEVYKPNYDLILKVCIGLLFTEYHYQKISKHIIDKNYKYRKEVDNLISKNTNVDIMVGDGSFGNASISLMTSSGFEITIAQSIYQNVLSIEIENYRPSNYNTEIIYDIKQREIELYNFLIKNCDILNLQKDRAVIEMDYKIFRDLNFKKIFQMKYSDIEFV